MSEGRPYQPGGVVVTVGGEGRVKVAFSWPLYLVGGLWIISLALMIWASVDPAPEGGFYLALGGFIGCSAVWTALQLTQAHRAPFLFVLVAGLLLLVAGAAILIDSATGMAWHPDDRWAVAAWVCVYLGLGFLVGLLRDEVYQRAWPFRMGLVFVAGGAAVILGVAIALLHGTAVRTFPVVMLGLSALLFLPIGLNVLSEKALDVARPDYAGKGQEGLLQQRDLPFLRKWWVWAVPGLVLSAGSVIFLTVVSHSGWTVLIVAACGLGLLAALVSNTQADIVVVLCVIVLLGIAPSEVDVALAQPLIAGAPAPPADLLALGDSYMSGEGASTYITDTDEAGSDTCRRSPTAYAVLAVGPEKPFDHVTFLACSGARTFNVLPQPPGNAASQGPEPRPSRQQGEPGTQVDEITALGPAYRPRLAIVSLGGNDAGFSDLAEACVAPGDCTQEQDLFLGNLRRVRSALVKTYESIRAVLPHTPVAVVPYRQPLDNARGCGAIALSAQERAFIQNFVISLDKVIESAANQVRFYYMDTMENALGGNQHLQLCDSANRGGYGINFVSPESVAGLPDQRFNPVNWLHDSFHPNERGHQAMLDAFAAWLKKNPHLTIDAPANQDKDAAAIMRTLPAVPSCYFNGTVNSCETVLQKWEYSQILALWPYSICVVMGLIGLWMLSIAGLSRCPFPSRPRPGRAPRASQG